MTTNNYAYASPQDSWLKSDTPAEGEVPHPPSCWNPFFISSEAYGVCPPCEIGGIGHDLAEATRAAAWCGSGGRAWEVRKMDEPQISKNIKLCSLQSLKTLKNDMEDDMEGLDGCEHSTSSQHNIEKLRTSLRVNDDMPNSHFPGYWHQRERTDSPQNCSARLRGRRRRQIEGVPCASCWCCHGFFSRIAHQFDPFKLKAMLV